MLSRFPTCVLTQESIGATSTGLAVVKMSREVAYLELIILHMQALHWPDCSRLVGVFSNEQSELNERNLLYFVRI